MEFCDDCGSLMKATSDSWQCTSCNGEQSKGNDGNYVFTDEQEGDEVIEGVDTERSLPKTDQQCNDSNCDNERAYWYLQQTRAADESDTRFYICTDCGNKWREYD